MSVVRAAVAGDMDICAELAEARRARYEAFEPLFWKRKPGSEAMSKAWFNHLLSQSQHVFLVAEWAGAPVGFLIASPVPTPPVHDAGPTAVIDDFCVEAPGAWPSVGQHLLREARARLKERGIKQIVVISGFQDAEKKAFLESEGLSLASTWWTSPV